MALDAAEGAVGLEHFLIILQLKFRPLVASTRRLECESGLAGSEVLEPKAKSEPGP